MGQRGGLGTQNLPKSPRDQQASLTELSSHSISCGEGEAALKGGTQSAQLVSCSP